MRADLRPHPYAQRLMIRRDSELRIVGQCGGDQAQTFGMDEAPVFMPAFGPRVGEQQKGAIDRSLGQALQQKPCVFRKNAHILRLVLIQKNQKTGDAVDERLASDQTGLGIGRRLRGQMLAAAETDLQPDLGRLRIE